MSLYNSERFLKEAIDSVLAQTFTDFEFIIVDDGSSDDSVNIVRGYDDVRIHLLCQKNAGLAAALNHAIDTAKTDFIARMDPDDICLSNRLERQYEYLRQHEQVVLVGSTAYAMNESGELLPEIRVRDFYNKGEMALPESPCIHPSVMFRRVAFEQAGGYPDEMRYGGEDAVLFNRMLVFGCIANMIEPLMQYRLHEFSMSHKSRRFNRLLRVMICQKVRGEEVRPEQLQQLMAEYGLAGSGQFGYQLYVGKLFLASGDMDSSARASFMKAIKAKPLSLYAWICFAGSLMPASWRSSLQSAIKVVKYGR